MERPFEEFGSKVFSEKEMLERLPSPVYKAWKKTLASEGQLDRPTADAIAHAMKRWAMEHGATHFTHWFQPLNGTTAEKHDAFVEPDGEGEPITRFSGKMLIKGEPDASSFPSGGLRATFEARGYTYWDVTSPVFIKDDVLCIPTVFVSYNGEALDRKEPLLKSLDALSVRATKVCNLLGDDSVKKCDISVGLEQEYFLIDRKYYEKRLDLKLTGRTLFGTAAPKGQELSDHYFGAIPSRVKAYMKEVNEELWKLGVYAKTEHNEVAPAQFELAPVFSGGNIAVDQNLIIMDILKRVAEKHGFACLLHEKPFDGINGSGKHNNDSIVTDNGQNLFAPGKKPEENIRFLTFTCAFIKAVDTYPILLRLSASSAGNDHRLGANEAPPAIISIYLGSYIEDVLYRVCRSEGCSQETGKKSEFTPVTNISYIPHDNTDRNRTSPVAFTGNKFEFRMLGSSMNASFANTVLSSIIADALQEVIDILSKGSSAEEITELAYGYCRSVIREHKRVLFSGDGYSEEWVKEAERRGLPNVKSFIEATQILKDPSVEKMFTSLGVFTKVELDANRKIMEERYRYIMDIEVRTMIEMTTKDVLPAMEEEYMFFDQVKDGAPSFMKKRKQTLADLIDETAAEVDALSDSWQKALEIEDLYQSGYDIYYHVVPAMEKLRSSIDAYESIASRKFYTLPMYEQMLFDR